MEKTVEGKVWLIWYDNGECYEDHCRALEGVFAAHSAAVAYLAHLTRNTCLECAGGDTWTRPHADRCMCPEAHEFYEIEEHEVWSCGDVMELTESR